MARAIDLAWRGWGRVHPNPLVGATVIAGGALVGEGWHAEYGDRHAEPIALADAGERARGGTLVVTLEPCAHRGKQPPCTDAIVRSGIRRVVAAVADPNPLAAGGADRLRAAGVEVELGLLARQAADQNAMFLHQFRGAGRPFVAIKLATSIDGRIADAAGRSRWISGEAAQEYVHWLRAGYDAIAVGGRTARADDPQLTVRGPVDPRVEPRRVVFDAAADLDPELTVIRTARRIPTFVVTSPAAPSSRAERLAECGATIVPAASLADAMRALGGYGIGSLLVEGGGRLAGALVGQDLADRFYWVQSPLWLGERGVAAIGGLPSAPIDRAARWRPVERRALGEDTLLVLDRI
ncbi:MAG TPA: bifunctional diaminohydroxyphosphoribosylaminopyrimidine deaminase/5-amino-6-(5-phosphoribosylamino)uracil reductase RibD [Gemmatimonadales bacterium]|nr:bifunctional diaminohydroxyphosphoribosylaminopyrimidine deaminase/5-amino-6-(5-phosphoribosylamino)uracil reductase RibD [Gemmatimonadales bacterium]